MAPLHGDVWTAELSPTRGHEQDGTRPVLVVSIDQFNRHLLGMAITIPLTSRVKDLPGRVAIHPPEGGLREVSYALCDQIRSISHERLTRRLGRVSDSTLLEVMLPMRFFLAL